MNTKQHAFAAMTLLALAGAAMAQPAQATPSVPTAAQEPLPKNEYAVVAAAPRQSSFWPSINWMVPVTEEWMN